MASFLSLFQSTVVEYLNHVCFSLQDIKCIFYDITSLLKLLLDVWREKKVHSFSFAKVCICELFFYWTDFFFRSSTVELSIELLMYSAMPAGVSWCLSRTSSRMWVVCEQELFIMISTYRVFHQHKSPIMVVAIPSGRRNLLDLMLQGKTHVRRITSTYIIF